MLEIEDLNDVILIGHSYGGMVATGVADRARARVTQLDLSRRLRADATGSAVFDLLPPDVAEKMRAGAAASGERLRLCRRTRCRPTRRRRTSRGRRRGACRSRSRLSRTPLKLSAEPSAPRSYIYCTKAGPDDTFRPVRRARAKREGWRYFEIDASHNPHITAPAALLAILNEIAAP